MVAIEVRFKDYGLKILEVIDNGSGIALENYESIGKPSLLRPLPVHS
jgi:DNA mismatch repair ATPase MutL